MVSYFYIYHKGGLLRTKQRESKFEGSVSGFIGYGLILVILTICTFGIAYPWGEVMFRR